MRLIHGIAQVLARLLLGRQMEEGAEIASALNREARDAFELLRRMTAAGEVNRAEERLFDLRGPTAPLLTSLPQTSPTLNELQAIETTQEKGKYKKHITIIREPKTIELLSIAIIQRFGQGGLTWEDILQHPALFPFQIENVTQADMAASEKLHLEKMGGRIIIVAKND